MDWWELSEPSSKDMHYVFFIVCKLDNKRRQGLVGQTLDDDGTMQVE